MAMSRRKGRRQRRDCRQRRPDHRGGKIVVDRSGEEEVAELEVRGMAR